MRYAQRLQAIYYIEGKKIRRLIKQKSGHAPRLSTFAPHCSISRWVMVI